MFCDDTLSKYPSAENFCLRRLNPKSKSHYHIQAVIIRQNVVTNQRCAVDAVTCCDTCFQNCTYIGFYRRYHHPEQFRYLKILEQILSRSR